MAKVGFDCPFTEPESAYSITVEVFRKAVGVNERKH
jgi:hypothetical protein